ncbi:PIG-L family deacetylase [Phormidium sp. LEGE 05292]|uniref:PIG-L deacetylase family protein n=1 Tax=[Phormidium] sp. LEGE 05292 TaxID=767427 RepID=UPI00188072BC|nr:PIG-L family deacetylase [Phormidium sp. LEGE 05292]MBE9224078.1 PIG-L family deacetylase [Phormidium sp. LEGE 05292]
MSKTHLFLSPHFDDVVGSCGGFISRLSENGEKVHILTIFGGDALLPLSELANELHSIWGSKTIVTTRRNEDILACKKLGAISNFLPFPDSIYRQNSLGEHLYLTIQDFRTLQKQEDDHLPLDILCSIKANHNISSAIIYCPMANGNHVDHILTQKVGLLLKNEGYNVILYQDFYYEHDDNKIFNRFLLKRININLSDKELTSKINAFKCYKSQIICLFESWDSMEDYFRTVGSIETFAFFR